MEVYEEENGPAETGQRGGLPNLKNFDEGLLKGPHASIKCRSLRIGSYKVLMPKEDVRFVPQGIRMTIPPISKGDGNEDVTIDIPVMEIEKILAHFGRGCLTMFFVYVRPSMGNIIRNILKMTDQSGVYFDPCSLDESQQLITILPEKFVNVNRDGFRVIYISQASNSTTSQCILHEIDQDEANVILFRSTPEATNKKTQETDCRRNFDEKPDSDFTSTEMVTIKQEKEDDSESMVIIEQDNGEHNFNENCKIPIEKDCVESERDPLCTNEEIFNNEDDMIPIEEAFVEIEKDPLSKNSEYFNSEDDMEIRNIYNENDGNLNLNESNDLHKMDTSVEPEKKNLTKSLRSLRINKCPIRFNDSDSDDDCRIITPPPRPPCPIITLDDETSMNEQKMEENSVKKKLDLSEPEKEEKQDNISGSENNKSDRDDNPLQDEKIDKYLKMWKFLYSEVDAQEQRNIYQENDQCVPKSMDKMRLLNEERKRYGKMLNEQQIKNKIQLSKEERKRKKLQKIRNIRIENDWNLESNKTWKLESNKSNNGHRKDLPEPVKQTNSLRNIRIAESLMIAHNAPWILTHPKSVQLLEQPQPKKKQPQPKKKSLNYSKGIVADTDEDVVVPEGWNRKAVLRTVGISAGKSDVYYYSPKGKKLRSSKEVERYCLQEGIEVDMSLFKWSNSKSTRKYLKSPVSPSPKTSKTPIAPKYRGNHDHPKGTSKSLSEEELVKSVTMNSPIVYIEKIDWTSKSTEQKKQFLIEEEIRYKQMNANKLKFEETSGSMVDRGAMQLNEESGKLKNLRNFRIDLQHQRVLGTNHQESSTFCEQPSEGR